jgi:hypothetical protein
MSGFCPTPSAAGERAATAPTAIRSLIKIFVTATGSLSRAAISATATGRGTAPG